MLGHEIGHVIARHSSERLAKQQCCKDCWARWSSAAAITPPQIGQVVGSMINMSYAARGRARTDSLGVRIMAEAGYDPAMMRVMEVLATSSEVPGSRSSCRRTGARKLARASRKRSPSNFRTGCRKDSSHSFANMAAGNFERR